MAEMIWTRELYDMWREEWTREHPNRAVIGYEDFCRLTEMFNLTPAELFGIEGERIGARFDSFFR
jgi:hypothetical protein